MNRELCIQLELFSIPTSSGLWNDNEGELIYQIYEILILIIVCSNNGLIFSLITSTRTKGISFNIIIIIINLISHGYSNVFRPPYPA